MDSSTIQNQASIIREFASHPGMKLVVEKLEGRVSASKMAWMQAPTAEDAEKIRHNAKCYATLMSILNEFLVRAKQDESTRTNTSEPVQQ